MNGQKLTNSHTATQYLAVLLASSALLTAGCANLATTATSGNNFGTNAVTTSGRVHGGNQPVTNARVQLYGVGQTGAGSAATLLATHFTDQGGNFNFNKVTSGGPFSNAFDTYICPSGADQLLYVKVVGGNTQGTSSSTINNAASVFLSPIGFCSQVSSSTFVNVSEVTTAATIAAAAQFINPATESIGADGIAVEYIAIANSFKLVNTMVSQSTGLANSSVNLTPVAGGLNNSTVTMTATPEAAKLNTIANILSSCVNQVSATSANNCSTLFANATPPPNPARTSQPGATFGPATDVMQAALYMFLNPTDGSTAARTNLYNLAPASGAPFQPTITSVPTDWTLAVAYSTTSQCGTTSSGFFAKPYDMSLDGDGNLWISNTASNGALVEISNLGEPANCATFNSRGIGGGQIDVAGNVWMGDTQTNNLYRLTPVGASSITPANPANSVRVYSTAGPVMAITSDGAGNIFFTSVVAGAGSVYKIDFGSSTTVVTPPTLISTSAGPAPARIFPDKAGDLFVSSGSNFVTQVSPGASGPNFINGYTSTQIGGIPSPTYGIVVGPTNRVFVTSRDPAASLTVLGPSGSNFVIQPGFPTAATIGGLSNPAGIWIDGEQNSFIANNAPEPSGLYGLSVLDGNGAAISPGLSATSGGYQKSQTYLNALRNVVVDASGNVWVTNDNNPNSITEVVGLGVQIFTSYATGLQNGRFQAQP